MLLPQLDPPAAAGGFRRAGPDDVAPLAALLGSAFPSEAWTPARVDRELTSADDVIAVLLSGDDAGLTATASARHDAMRYPGIGYLHWVAVAPRARGRGLGREAVLATVSVFADCGFEQVVLETDDDRLPAISSYLGLGFIPLLRADDHGVRWSGVFRSLSARSCGGSS